jgi:hypothetical protein
LLLTEENEGKERGFSIPFCGAKIEQSFLSFILGADEIPGSPAPGTYFVIVTTFQAFPFSESYVSSHCLDCIFVSTCPSFAFCLAANRTHVTHPLRREFPRK